MRLALTLLVSLIGFVPGAVAAAGSGGELWRRSETSWVLATATSADGQRIAIGTRSNVLRVVDRRGQPIWSYAAGGSIRSVSLSADGRWLAAASEDRHLYLLDEKGTVLWQAKAPRSFNQAAVADDASLVAGTADDQTLYVYDHQGRQLWTYAAGDEIRALAIYGTGEVARVVTGANDAMVRIFSRTGELLLQGYVDQDVEALAVTPTGSRIAVACRNRKIYLLDGSSARVLWTYPASDDLNSVAISGDGNTILAAGRDGDVLWLDGQGKRVDTLPVGAEVLSVAVSRDGSTFVIGTTSNAVILLDRQLAVAAREWTAGRQRLVMVTATLSFLAVLSILAILAHFTWFGRQLWSRQRTAMASLAREIWRRRLSYALLVPTLAFLLTFNYYPAASALYHAFTEWEPGVRTTWVGLENFSVLLHDQYFAASIWNIVILVVTSLLKTFTVPLLVAELIFAIRSPRAQYWWRTAYVIPLVVPGVALILVWRNILDPNIGLLNQLLGALGLSHLTRAWLGDPATALSALIFIGFPWAAAFPILIFYGGLIAIPTDLFDAIQVDGASFWRRFWQVDVPLLTAQFRLLLILGFVNAIETFELSFLTTGGGPGTATYTPALELYYTAIRFNRMGVAAAIGLVMFVAALAVTMLSMRFLRSAVEFDA